MVRKALLVPMIGVIVLVMGIALAGLTPAYAASVTATFTKQAWSNGYTGSVAIKNDTASTVNGWRVEFDLAAGTTVGTYWEALLTSSGNHYVFTNRNYNGSIAPGATVTFGFIGNGTGDPLNCRINGASCSGTTPTPPPTTAPPTTAPPTTPPPTTPPPTTPPPTTPPPAIGLPKHALVGYLHASFANGSGYLRMGDVPAEWDIINLAFAEPTSVTSGDLRFHQCPVAECANVESEADFIAGIRAQQAKGKKVLISVGGQNGQVQLNSAGARDAFVRSASAIIDKYGLDGLDVDFEGHSLSLNAGDRDFRNPTTPVIVNLISALKTLKARYGSRFVLTMAPETFFVQLGYQFYGSGAQGGADPRAASYLPVIHALRNDLTLLHVQDYNSGPIMGLDNQYHTMGTHDFHVAMTDMLLAGFPIERNPNNVFPALRQDQVAIGLPAAPYAGNGHTSVAEVQKALDCLVKGRNCGSYQPRGVYLNMRGLMTWSINWDKYNNYEFSRNHNAYLDALP
jgi:chitinase